MMVGIYNASPDEKGRILLPPEFATQLGADKNIYIVGFGDHIEIWPKETWDKSSNKFDYQALMEAIGR